MHVWYRMKIPLNKVALGLTPKRLNLCYWGVKKIFTEFSECNQFSLRCLEYFCANKFTCSSNFLLNSSKRQISAFFWGHYIMNNTKTLYTLSRLDYLFPFRGGLMPDDPLDLPEQKQPTYQFEHFRRCFENWSTLPQCPLAQSFAFLLTLLKWHRPTAYQHQFIIANCLLSPIWMMI